ncbi:phosphotransferase [Streptomyces demainii]|uniref:Aminoglycoside phosphotransferase domain-containing protein n=1 Tax=Streptomyces demainii TaxID=588122 RepID=A0ABT9KH68_9ACTN|nr:phosphotransferase [Streptomyces demainii]MDP9607755.1 hypothetical protein [Streptomyces demainii]
MSTWEFVKTRTAADGGAVWRSPDGPLFKRTGGLELLKEAELLQRLAADGYPVPAPVDRGRDADGRHYFTERSVGESSLHQMAVADTQQHGHVTDRTIETAARVSARLLAAQARHTRPADEAARRQWFERAAFTADVYTENPDLDTDRTRQLVTRALDRLTTVPMCESHLDYGMPNAFPGGVIDWQHHALAPLGYDVYPMLEIAAFKGGNKGYTFTPDQRAHYLKALDKHAARTGGHSSSAHLSDFLLVKCFFFLALMRPTDSAARPDKHTKWQYRRALFTEGLAQYESTHTIDTAAFPTLADFTNRLSRPAPSRP